MSRKIVVAGVTGNIGSKLATQLIELGHQVIGIGRDKAKLPELGLTSIAFREGQLSDVPFLTSVLQEADAAFLLIPPHVTAADVPAHQKEVGEAIAQAVKTSGIRYVVNLSSLGADLTSGTGPILGVHDQEQRLNEIASLNVLHLRPAYFMENLLNSIPMIQHMGIMGSATKADIAFPAIATQDIAQAAAQLLDKLDFQGSTVKELLGSGNYTMQEMTQQLGKALGKPDLPYVEFSYEDAQHGLEQAGLSPSMASLYVEMLQGMNERGLYQNLVRTPQNTTPTSLESFLETVKGSLVAAR